LSTSKTYSQLPRTMGPYVHAVRHHDTLYVSGLTAANTEAQSARLEEQTAEILRQLEVILAHEQRGKLDLIKLTIYLRDINTLPLIRTLLLTFFSGHFPACTMVEVSGLVHPDLLIEVEGIIALA
jgi:2-iminobutanoate/2-iminopropanoate deaminase